MMTTLPTRKSEARSLLNVLAFLFTLHYALIAYLGSSFLGDKISPNAVDVLYSLASLVTILAFLALPKILKREGNYGVTFVLIMLDLLSLIGLARGASPLLLGVAFILNFATIALVGFDLDVFLESISSDRATGNIRGTFLTASNLAWVISPVLAGFIIAGNNGSGYAKVFIASALLLVPTLLILTPALRGARGKPSTTSPLRRTLSVLWKQKDLRGIFAANFLLQFFYTWMVIYTPLYLHDRIGFGWNEIGIIFSIMLLPFLLTELPLGILADKKWGEKEALTAGFVVMALSTAALSFITVRSIAVFASILFVTRVGAAMVEIMSETYFFKRIDTGNTETIALFRTLRPWCYLISPAIAFLLIPLIGMKYLFLVLGATLLLGIRFSLSLKDTR